MIVWVSGINRRRWYWESKYDPLRERYATCPGHSWVNMEIKALYTGEKWLPYQEAGAVYYFTVHSIFSKVINFVSGGELLSVAAESAGCSSSFLTIPGRNAERCISCDSGPGRRCMVQAGVLHLENCTINFRNAALWKGPVSKEYRHYKKIKDENIAAFKAVLDRKAAPQSAWSHLHGNCKNKITGFNVIRKLHEDPSLARSLIGLGQGLTPAGDDMLVGFLSMVNHLYENRKFVSELHEIILGSIGETVDLSAQVLANALNWDYHEYIQICIRDLCEGEKEAVYVSTASLLSMGASSGSDIACGMYFGMLI